MSLGILSAGCSSGRNEIKASLGREFILPVGYTAVIDGENLGVKFNAVTQDSRCPKGVTCIWAGEAKCDMQISLKGLNSEVLLSAAGGTDGYSFTSFHGYRLNFKLEPYPEKGEQIAKSDYKLLMIVKKQIQ